jgi:hypothetical protein
MARVLTVVLRLENEGEAKQLWDSHMNGTHFAGCIVEAISNGDILCKLEEVVNIAISTENKIAEIEERMDR